MIYDLENENSELTINALENGMNYSKSGGWETGEIICANHLAKCLTKLKRYDEAEKVLHEFVLDRKDNKTKSRRRAHGLVHLAIVERETNREIESLRHLQEARKIYGDSMVKDYPMLLYIEEETAKTKRNLGVSDWKKHFNEADEIHQLFNRLKIDPIYDVD